MRKRCLPLAGIDPEITGRAGKKTGKIIFARKKGVKYVPGIRVITRIPGTY